MNKQTIVNKNVPTKITLNVRKSLMSKLMHKSKEISDLFNDLISLPENKLIIYNKIKEILNEIKEIKFKLTIDKQVYDLFFEKNENNITNIIDQLINNEYSKNIKKEELVNLLLGELNEEENCINLVNQD
ncbi:hypothetical protein H312_01211 [Anncaliia algerae PRA339]|uniref:Uncharacterized protein n=1 Tax=Anncaliia algerae PRA339 TaxID=1288291 RepID=A0A059F2J5_9MICR|nr:hypothetical protein H312_01211 [Anncaliia algerae PRA339]